MYICLQNWADLGSWRLTEMVGGGGDRRDNAAKRPAQCGLAENAGPHPHTVRERLGLGGHVIVAAISSPGAAEVVRQFRAVSSHGPADVLILVPGPELRLQLRVRRLL